VKLTGSRPVARAERLPHGTDPLGGRWPDGGFFFRAPDRAIAAVGAARTITVPAGPGQVGRAAALAREVLGELAHPVGGPRPFVVGALPFDGMTPAALVVPRVGVVTGPGGSAWRITVDADDGPDPAAAGPSRAQPGSGAGPPPLEVSPVPERAAYLEAVSEARRRIRAGRLEKVVLARMLVVRAGHDLDRAALLRRLLRAEPNAYVFGVHGFVGASPELLVARTGRTVEANPLAGTAIRSADAASDAAAADGLRRSEKDLAEHAPVVQAVREGLEPVCDELAVDEWPEVIGTARLWHLSTMVRGTLRRPAPSVLELAARLHPTPAVCGTPREAAMAAIGELERIDRTLYAGLVGWTDTEGDGQWAVALRCAEVQGRIALLFAGAGIVADSDPEAELAETDAKFRSMLDALGYG